jgi:hypothetical protein
MDKKLEIGTNYGDIFGLDPKKGMRMIYLGGNKWRCEKPGVVKEIEGEVTTKNAIEYINQPSIHMGRI